MPDLLNTPSDPSWLPFAEKANFAGILIAGISYGIVVALFFQCMGALLNPANTVKESIKWVLVAHTMAMFTFVTVFTVSNLDLLSISHIDNRDFPGDATLSPGPFEYQFLIYSKPIYVAPYIMFFLNSLLADGLLLYRCCVIYAMKYEAIAFPCAMYIASLVTGIILIFQNARPDGGVWASSTFDFGYPYFFISLSLNVLLTLMIITRLFIQNRSISNGNKNSVVISSNGFNKAIVTMLIESFVLYTVNLSLVIGSWSARSYILFAFFPVLAETQVIAPFLITLRVASRSISTSDTIVFGKVDSIYFEGHGKPTDSSNSVLPQFAPMNTVDLDEETPGGFDIAVETVVEEFRS